MTWHTFAGYLALLESHHLGLNVVQNVGATQVRRIALGDLDRKPTAAQLNPDAGPRRGGHAELGSVGVSSALIYPPANYATTDELIALNKISAPYGGTYFTHMRNEGNDLLPAIREAIRIGVEGGVPVPHIYHLKAAGKENWGPCRRAIALIDSARAAGINVTADATPTSETASHSPRFWTPVITPKAARNSFKTLFDPNVRRQLRHEVETGTTWENWYRHVGMDWDKVLITGVARGIDSTDVGLSIAGVAKHKKGSRPGPRSSTCSRRGSWKSPPRV